MRTEKNDEAKLKMLVDAGLRPKVASDRLILLEELTVGQSRKFSSPDEIMDVCYAVIGNNKPRRKAVIDAELKAIDSSVSTDAQ
ncbi:MAG: hypothetical protein ACTHKM_14045 [Tsuneonella sp.]